MFIHFCLVLGNNATSKLRHTDVISGAHQNIQDFAQQETFRASNIERSLRGRSRKTSVLRKSSRCHAEGTTGVFIHHLHVCLHKSCVVTVTSRVCVYFVGFAAEVGADER